MTGPSEGSTAATEIVAVDIGGTHARFALAVVRDGEVIRLGKVTILRTAEHASLEDAWTAFSKQAGQRLPRAAAIAVASPIIGDAFKLTNSSWIIRPSRISDELDVDHSIVINDFAAVGHAVAAIGPEHLRPICGPERPLEDEEVISIVGPGTGFGVGHILRKRGRNHAVASEGGHIAFAPLDDIDNALLRRLRERYGRVSVERILSGPGLANIHETLAAVEGSATGRIDEKELWKAALDRSDDLAAAALDRFCLILGSVSGDIALAQGGTAVVVAGGLGLRLASYLPQSGFSRGFVAKGRLEAMMATIPVKLVTHPQPGLYGAAAAFASKHR